eukprot:Sspe_Gene.1473::Locus_487_Transcript_1_1_Confidence_1.000_Length_3120::g.1473::m.1473
MMTGARAFPPHETQQTPSERPREDSQPAWDRPGTVLHSTHTPGGPRVGGRGRAAPPSPCAPSAPPPTPPHAAPAAPAPQPGQQVIPQGDADKCCPGHHVLNKGGKVGGECAPHGLPCVLSRGPCEEGSLLRGVVRLEGHNVSKLVAQLAGGGQYSEHLLLRLLDPRHWSRNRGSASAVLVVLREDLLELLQARLKNLPSRAASKEELATRRSRMVSTSRWRASTTVPSSKSVGTTSTSIPSISRQRGNGPSTTTLKLPEPYTSTSLRGASPGTSITPPCGQRTRTTFPPSDPRIPSHRVSRTVVICAGLLAK